MKGYDVTSPKVPALTRTWRVDVIYRECSVVTGNSTHTVTLSRAQVGGPLVATVDGEEADVARAVKLLGMAEGTPEVLAETLAPMPAPGIGKPAACELHRELGRLKFRDHYATASEALGRAVESLAALTAREAHTVRSYAYGQWGMPA